MTNTEFLLSVGFTVKDGWLCSPAYAHEATFHADEIDAAEMTWIIHVIASTSFNAGVRWQKRNETTDIVRELKGIIKRYED